MGCQESCKNYVRVVLCIGLLSACGAGGSDNNSSVSPVNIAIYELNAPQKTGNVALDGHNWFNYRRAQMGMSVLTRNTQIEAAAQGHSQYQANNNIITHTQSVALLGFTGMGLRDRLIFAGYKFEMEHAYGEVISLMNRADGVEMAESLLTAIYHRYVVLEPVFKEMGSGIASRPDGYTYFTTNLVSNKGLGVGLGHGRLAPYPIAGQKYVPISFNSNQEAPDPVEDRAVVGYPVSVHADFGSRIVVENFSITERGQGKALATYLKIAASDPHTPPSAAAIIPVDILKGNSTYDVKFIGTVNGIDASVAWSFQTL